MNKKQSLTFHELTIPLREALEKHSVNEDTMVKVYSDIAFNEDISAATRLHAIEMFLKLLGITASEKIDINHTGDLGDAIAEIEQRRKEKRELQKREEKYSDI